VAAHTPQSPTKRGPEPVPRKKNLPTDGKEKRGDAGANDSRRGQTNKHTLRV